MREYAEELDELSFGMPGGRMDKLDIYDHAKFDKINIFDFRRNLPQKLREARIDS
jgi:hypothetical protein